MIAVAIASDCHCQHVSATSTSARAHIPGASHGASMTAGNCRDAGRRGPAAAECSAGGTGLEHTWQGPAGDLHDV